MHNNGCKHIWSSQLALAYGVNCFMGRFTSCMQVRQTAEERRALESQQQQAQEQSAAMQADADRHAQQQQEQIASLEEVSCSSLDLCW